MKKLVLFLYLYSFIYANEQEQTLVDTKNHLEWQDTLAVEKEEKWAMLNRYCHSLHLLGHNDWRAPTVSELKTIITMGELKLFHYGESADYWTSEEDKNEDGINAWAIYMPNGHLFSNDKCETAYMRCVRTKF